MKNWSIKSRILAGGGALLLLLGILSALSLYEIKVMRGAIARLNGDFLPGVTYASDMMQGVQRSHLRVSLAALAQSEEERAKMIQNAKEATAFTEQASRLYEAAISSDEDRANFTQFLALRKEYSQRQAKYLEMLLADQTVEANTYLFAQLDPHYIKMREHLSKMVVWNKEVGSQFAEAETANAGKAMTLVLITVGAAFAIAGVLGLIIIRSINQALLAVNHTISEASQQVSSASSQVSGSSQSLAEGASEQAASLEETSASLEEINSMAKRNAESSGNLLQLAGEAKQATEIGVSEMKEMSAAMDAIRQSSDNIAKIVKGIDEIAFQTNLLALNAAVEAARAGEAGAGFAVVADEVRSLAQRAANAAKETSEKIEDSIAKSARGSAASAKVASSLQGIEQKTTLMTALVAEISSASNEQTQGISQIGTALSQMDKVTQGSAAHAEETASAAQELHSQAERMAESVDVLTRLVGGKAAVASTSHARSVGHSHGGRSSSASAASITKPEEAFHA